ncbi:MAG: Ig-like domain-containing protein [Bacteroidales bacterium]|nr:Ig-like domain-containing protein [Bacteroidales bacterium]
MINPFDITQTGTITGMVYDTGTTNPLEDVLLVANGISEAYTDSTGFFQIDSVLAGLVNIQTYKSGYGSKAQVVELSSGGYAWAQFILNAPAPEIMSVVPSDSAENVDVMTSITINFDTEMDTTTLNSSTFILSDTRETLPGTLTMTLTSLTFTPTVPFRLNMLHRASISIEARSINGISLDWDYSWEFITQEVTSREEGISNFESGCFLFPNYPNPFILPTSIGYQLSIPGHVELSIYNSLGQNVRRLINEHQIPGQYQVQWDGYGQNGIPLASGLYLYRLRVGKFIQTRKMLMFK